MITIAVDCMGGDHGPEVTLPACREFLDRHPDAALVLVGLADALKSFSHPRATVVVTTEVVTMDDALEVALRKKKDSSMRVAIQQVKDGAAQAAVSAGNTGALMAISRYILKTLDGIERPAIAGQIPNAKGGATTVLDLGPMWIARPNTCCSLRSWARRWCRCSAAMNLRRWACSTLVKRSSKATKSSKKQVNFCEQPRKRVI